MHLEVFKVRLHSLKDFAKHYLMIVLSILTALGLEAWIEHAHHRHAAAAASMQIDAEIHANQAAIGRARAHDAARMRSLENLRNDLLRDIRAHLPDATIIQHAREKTPDGLYLDWRWPILRHEAWDVAVANQSASWIDDDQLRRYSAIYAAQARSDAMMAEDIPTVLDGPRMIDAIIDLQTHDIRPDELLHVVNQMASLANEATNNLDGLARKIDPTQRP